MLGREDTAARQWCQNYVGGSQQKDDTTFIPMLPVYRHPLAVRLTEHRTSVGYSSVMGRSMSVLHPGNARTTVDVCIAPV